MWIEKREYLCMCCGKWIIEDDMISWNVGTKKGFCRECDECLDFDTKQRIGKDGFDYGEQLSLL